MNGLRLERIAVRRKGRLVLQALSAAFPPGSLTAVIGPNGAGKSTLLTVAAGLLRPCAGEATLDGRPLQAIARRELARRRAYLPQTPRADWPLSVERVVALGLIPSLSPSGGLPPALQARLEETLATHDLLPLRARPVSEVSGGELARTMLARALVGEPELLIVDEPTAGLDPRHGLDSARRLRAWADGGAAVVMAIHDLTLALRFADRVLAVRDGRLVAHGAASDVLDAPLLERLYDLPARIVREADSVSVHFAG